MQSTPLTGDTVFTYLFLVFPRSVVALLEYISLLGILLKIKPTFIYSTNI